MTNTFDFVIVGGGTAGPLVAARLAATLSRPSVLLIEAGQENDDIALRAPYDRFITSFAHPELDYGYTTVPQAFLNNRKIKYPRGKGLGGSSSVNFLVYTYGADEDYNLWADLVGDDFWRWEKTRERFKKIETLHFDTPEDYKQYVNPNYDGHGHNGPIGISLPATWELGQTVYFKASEEFGIPRNLDLNSGDAVGIGMTPSSYSEGKRTTSASANLSRRPNNLTVWTNAIATKILFEKRTAIGVQLADDRRVYAKKETILTCGAIDTPKLLLLSGVGPKEQLDLHRIHVVHNLPGVGKNLQDHCRSSICTVVKPGLVDRSAFQKDKGKVEAAREAWIKNQEGPFTVVFGSVAMAGIRLPLTFETEEFKDLAARTRIHIQQPTVPTYNMSFHGPFPSEHLTDEGLAYQSYTCYLMNPQSRGTVALASKDPADKPIVDPAHLSHPYDRRVMIDAIRNTLHFIATPILAKYLVSYAYKPNSDSDEDILTYLKSDVTGVSHANGTAMMGKPENLDAVVDTNFRVYGIERLRIADLSVCPISPCNHTQSTAYLVAQTAAEKIIAEYKL